MPTILNSDVLPALQAINGTREIPGITQEIPGIIHEHLPVRGALRIRKVRKTLIEHWNDLEEVRQEILRQHAQTGEDGEVVRLPVPEGMPRNVEGEPVWLTPESEGEANAAYAELMAEPFELSHGIEPQHLGEVKIMTQTAIQLGGVLVDPEDAAAGE